MKRILVLLGAVIMMMVLAPEIRTQNMNPASVDVSALSDAQIQRLISEVKKRGLSEQQALDLARVRGMSEGQLKILSQRMKTVSKNSDLSADLKPEFSLDSLFDKNENLYSKKPFIPFTKEEERLFGLNFFNSDRLTFQPRANIEVTNEYKVAVGDELRIDVYGASQQSYVEIVDNDGQIIIPNVGPIAVRGKQLSAVKKIVREKLSLIYRDLVEPSPNTFVNIHLGAIQAITVHVIGEVFAPGTYTLPGSATAFNALYFSGGPNIKGTFRDIRVIRNGKIIHRLDVYDYLINGNGEVNVALNDGDVIMVPTYGNRIKVAGEFIRNGIFESKQGESLQQMIEYAGGFNEYAFRSRIELYRNTGREHEVIDVLTDAFNETLLQNGDSIYVGKVLDRFTNRVSISGAVFRPGSYELTEGLMLSELIAKADGVCEDAFMERAIIIRLNSDLSLTNVSFSLNDLVGRQSDVLLKREDVVIINSVDEMREKQVVHISGEVQMPGSFIFRENMSLGDLILLSGGFKESASQSYIEITRRLSYEEALQPVSTVAKLFQFDIPRNLSLKSKDASFELLPFDEVYVRRAPGAIREGSVLINGEVRYAGTYALIKKNERISDLINRSGGLTDEAFLPGAMLTRPISLTAKERRLREFALSQNEGLEMKAMEFEVVGVDLSKAINNPGGRDDIFLRNGDELVIPRHNQTIQVGGGVLNPLSMPYIGGRGVKYYVKNSGGFALRAKRNRTYVVYPNGSAGATSNFLFFRSYPKVLPGSEIVVPQRPEKEALPVTAWISIGSGISTIALTLVTLINATK
ncbi:MAG TPA: SLBB domain-containing protein [Marinilabiliaceae bacterium]|nr:SLBB domain-containing protein [Marinilabiliaceae bacterium]